MARRGLRPELAQEHHVREIASPDEVETKLRERHEFDAIDKAGLVSKSDRFLFARHRLLFFYFGDDEPIYVQARDVTGTATVKELSPAGLGCPLPYNASVLNAPSLKEVFLCEGCLDTLSALQLGYPAIGIPGVQRFRHEWFELFQGVGRVKILFDNDDAGQAAAIELRAKFRRRGIAADVLVPTKGTDVNDHLLNEKGKGDEH